MPQAASLLKALLQHGSTLARFNLGFNELAADGQAEQLGLQIALNISLRELDLGSNPFVPSTIGALCTALGQQDVACLLARPCP